MRSEPNWRPSGGVKSGVVRAKAEADEKAVTEAPAAATPAAAGSGGGAGGSVLSFLCPLLKLFSASDPAAPRNRTLEVATTGLASMARLPWGSKVRMDLVGTRRAPEKPIRLYEFEACPFCRRVREALTELDLSAEVLPCPKGSIRHRPEVKRLGGKDQFPYMVDPNKGVALYESGDIVKYLFREYGGGASPSPGLLETTALTGWMPTLLRAGRGMSRFERAAAAPPAKTLELYSYENNQFARLVREALCELELPYLLHNVGKGSAGQVALRQRTGSSQVPYLVDNNTGAAVRESADILQYLFESYGKP